MYVRTYAKRGNFKYVRGILCDMKITLDSLSETSPIWWTNLSSQDTQHLKSVTRSMTKCAPFFHLHPRIQLPCKPKLILIARVHCKAVHLQMCTSPFGLPISITVVYNCSFVPLSCYWYVRSATVRCLLLKQNTFILMQQ